MTDSNKIVVNTGVSYAALLLKLVVGLFSVRLVLQALGEENYGIYVIVGGIVAMLDILNSNMSNTSMRYLAFSLGKKDRDDILITFNSTLVIHFLIGLITIAVLEFGGWLMFEYVVNIPSNRLFDAEVVYQFMVISTFITVIAVPFDAVTNAHEKIWILSVFDMIDILINLGIAIFLLYYGGNRLIVYGLCLLLSTIFIRFMKILYSKRNFHECSHFHKKMVSKERIRDILSFTGWNLFGSIAALGAGQFRSLIVNFFFGVRLNAAEGIAGQVGKPLNMMVSSMTRAINPQIMKSEGGKNRERMIYIVEMGAKYSTFLFALFGIPVLIETPILLKLWLKEVPEFSVIFCQLTILAMLMEKFTFQITHAVNAVGDIKGFQISIAFANLIYLPIAFILYKFSFPPETVYYLSLFSMLLNAIFRFYYGNKKAGINIKEYIKTAISPVLYPLLISFFIAFVLNILIKQGIVNIIVVSTSFCICFVILFWLIGMTKDEQIRWKMMAVQAKDKLSFRDSIIKK